MIDINIDEIRDFFRGFNCELLTSNEVNRNLIREFKSVKEGDELQNYLQNQNRAWEDDLDGETRVYLIKDKDGNIVCYFSLKCGLIVGDDKNECLSDDEREILGLYVEAKRDKNEELENSYYDSINSMYPERADYIVSIAMKRLERKTEAMEIGQSENTLNVPMCYSGIELKHLCRNANYVCSRQIEVPLGFGLFWEKIVPIIEEIYKKIGCKYLYLFAADDTKEDKDVKRLIRYYKDELKFYECDEAMKFVKPDYDNYCYGLIQEISQLISNREAVWEEFSDVWG